MATNPIENRLTLPGEVIETFEKGGRRIAKVALKSCHVDVSIDAIPDVHLGDMVLLEADIAVQKIKTFPAD